MNWRNFLRAAAVYLVGVASGVFSTLVADELKTQKAARETSCLFAIDVAWVVDSATKIQGGELISEGERPNTPMLDGAPITTIELPPELRLKVLGVQNEWMKLRAANIIIPLTEDKEKHEKEVAGMRTRAEGLRSMAEHAAEKLRSVCGR
jgi:hypothetical protein